MSARIALCAILLTSSVVHADGTDAVTVDQALTMFRERSPRVAAANAAVGVAAADLVDATIYPNPEVGFSTARTATGDTAGPEGQYTLDLSIPILIGGQRGRRKSAANAHVAAARTEVAQAVGEAELEIRARFAALLAAQERTTVLESALADARALRDIVAGRTSAGAGSPYAVERIDLAIASLASRVASAKAEESAASGDLAIAAGLPGWHPRALGDFATVAGPLPNTVDTEHPALAAARAAGVAARADELRARSEAVPTPSVGVQALSTATPNGLALSFGASVPLPLFDRNQGAIARAQAERRRAELELAAKNAELATELERAQRVLAARKADSQSFQADALQRLAKVRAMAEASYRSGQAGIVELLDALDAITEARLRDIDLRASVANAELDVRRAALGR